MLAVAKGRGELTATSGNRSLREVYDTGLIEKSSKSSLTEFVNDDEADDVAVAVAVVEVVIVETDD